ncbi:MAG TPA: M6 family metalloprotease domain-containing protein [Anaerolineae bacterium]|nr:M6 family metalloprotease domain-containing protein [Anaerolineae bacterium]
MTVTQQSYKKVMVLMTIMLLAALALVAAMPTSGASETAKETQSAQEVLAQVNGRLVPNERSPRDEMVAAQAAGISIDQLGTDAAQAELNRWFEDFYKTKQKSGPNPLAYAERLEDIRRAEEAGYHSPQQIGGGEIGVAKMLMIPFEFNGTDSIEVCDTIGGTGNVVDTIEITGPLHGTIPNPAGTGDNNTIWTDNFDVAWYEALMFGNGVGVVRTDLNNGAGVDMTGISARNWYLEQSEGLYDVQGEIYPQWIQLDHSVAWYGWDGDEMDPGNTGYPCGGTQSGWGFEFARDVAFKLNEVDPNFDWASYDLNGDNIVDHLMVIHAGVDNSAGGGEYGNYQLWAHSWDVWCDNDGSGTVGDSNADYGCMVDDMGTADTADDIYIANYTHIPEDADIGVVVHEYGHDIGLPDYYDQTGATSNSTAHWIVMSGGSWSGALGGSHPTPFNPWARWFFGWETPMQVNYDDPKMMVNIGQSDPTPEGTEDSVWINLPDQAITVENLAGDGAGVHSILGNMLTSDLVKEFDLTGTTNPWFTFTTYFEIEPDWDYTYIVASTDGGQNWDLLLNEEGEYATVDPNGSAAWLGEGGLTGGYEGKLTYDLTAYAGMSSVWVGFWYVTDQAVQDPGIWIDNITMVDGGTVLYYNDMEDTSDWTNNGWEVVPYNDLYSHYYMLEWRNSRGSIASMGHTQNYYTLSHAGEGWLTDKFSANVPGLLIWYRNNFYTNNQAVAGGREFDLPAFGPKGELLLVDANFEPITWSGGLWDPTGDDPDDPGIGVPAPTFSNRRSAMDGAFGVDQTSAWMIHDYANVNNPVMNFGTRAATPQFHDSLGYTSGWLYPEGNFVYRINQDGSVVIPGMEYTTRIRNLEATGTMPGGDYTGFWGFTVGGRVLGTGNPGDGFIPFGDDGGSQYGVHVSVEERAADGTYGTVKIWNAMYETEMMADYGSAVMEQADGSEYVMLGDSAIATFDIRNAGSPLSNTILIVELPEQFSYTPGSMSGSWVGISSASAATPMEAAQYVEANGFANLLAMPEPAHVAYFAFAAPDVYWWAGNEAPSLSYDYTANMLGVVMAEYYVYHNDVELLAGDNPRYLPTVEVVDMAPTSVALTDLGGTPDSANTMVLVALAVLLLAGAGMVTYRRHTA